MYGWGLGGGGLLGGEGEDWSPGATLKSGIIAAAGFAVKFCTGAGMARG